MTEHSAIDWNDSEPRRIDWNSPEGQELYDLYAERIWIHDYPEDSEQWIAGTGIPPAEPTPAMRERERGSMEDAMLAYEEEVESFAEWVREVYGHTITFH